MYNPSHMSMCYTTRIPNYSYSEERNVFMYILNVYLYIYISLYIFSTLTQYIFLYMPYTTNIPKVFAQWWYVMEQVTFSYFAENLNWIVSPSIKHTVSGRATSKSLMPKQKQIMIIIRCFKYSFQFGFYVVKKYFRFLDVHMIWTLSPLPLSFPALF